jgi:exonuclease I
VTPITASKINANLIYAFDLSQDPSELIETSLRLDAIITSKLHRDNIHKALQVVTTAHEKHKEDEVLLTAFQALTLALEELEKLPHLLERSSSIFEAKGIVKISINKIPFISPKKTITNDEETALRLKINVPECMKNYEKLIQSQNIPLNIVQQENNITYNEIDDVDFSLYSGPFLSSNDQDRCSIIRETKKEELKEIDFPFDDPRLHELLWRYRCRNFSETLSEEELKKWHNFCAQRIMQPLLKNGFGLSFFVRKIEEHLHNQDTSESDKALLASLKKYAVVLLSNIGITYPEPNL